MTGITAHADGTVSFRFAPLNTSTGIATVGIGAAEPVGFYTLDGTYLGTKAPETSTPQVLIVKDKEGKNRKVVRVIQCLRHGWVGLNISQPLLTAWSTRVYSMVTKPFEGR